jgi:hypothetical protein
MQDFSDFCAKQNLSRLDNQLQRETDSMRRVQLKELLIEEEDRLGSTVGRLQHVDRSISDNARRVEFQRTKISTLEQSGHDVTAATFALRNMEELQSIYRQYRLELLAAIDRNGVLNR